MKRLFSKIQVTIRKKHITRALNLILNENVTYLCSSIVKNGDLQIVIYSSKFNRLKNLFYENNIDFEFSKEVGLLANIKRNYHRLGLVFGAIFLIVMIFISSKFVWTINIQGNKKLSDEQILNELEKANFSLGSYIPKIDYKTLHNKVLLNSEEISWISVNITGSVANVLIRESLSEQSKDKKIYSNVVAKCDGQIALINVVEGKKQISIGDVVKKGDLLISGVLNSSAQGVRYVNAKGSVKAYVNKSISIYLPYTTTEKSYTKEVNSAISYSLFNNIIFFSKKYNKNSEFCDTIEKTEQVKLFNKIKLPIYRNETRFYEYEYNEVNYTKEQVIDKAFKELRQKLDVELKSAELVSKNIITNFDEEGFYVECNLYCLEDITSSIEFEIENNGG